MLMNRVKIMGEYSELLSGDLVIDREDGTIYKVVHACTLETGEDVLFYDSNKVVYKTSSCFKDGRLIRYYGLYQCGDIDKQYVNMYNCYADNPQPDVEPLRDRLIGKFYKHFKGHRYQILDVVLDSDDLSVAIVYQDIDHPERRWVRSYDEFFELVDRDNYTGPRFTEIKVSQTSLY